MKTKKKLVVNVKIKSTVRSGRRFGLGPNHNQVRR